jgi:chemotaxis protein MotB
MTVEYHASHHEADSEDSYFVSMTDIMVGMLFVFIILLMYFVFRIQDTSEPVVRASVYEAVLKERDAALKERDAALKEIERLNMNPLEKYLKAADAARESILQSLKQDMEKASGMRPEDIKVIPEQGILRLSGDVLFPKAVSIVTPGSPSDKALQALALALSKVLPCFSLGPAGNATKSCNPNAAFIDAVFVEGHTDNQPITKALPDGVVDNLSLSARRAINTLQAIYLHEPKLNDMYSISPSEVGLGLGEGHSPLMNASEFGETRPAASNNTEEGKRSNRRIDIRVLMYSPKSENLDAVRKLLDR